MFIVSLICRRCKKEIGKIERPTNRPKERRKLCDLCKKEANIIKGEMMGKINNDPSRRTASSERMKKNNPMFDREVVLSMRKTTKEHREQGLIPKKVLSAEHLQKMRDCVHLSEEDRKKLSERMKKNNPMFRPETKEKVSKTRQEKIENGEIKYKHGAEHHLWQGGSRDFNNTCRSHLYLTWTKKIFERDNYTCALCSGEKYKDKNNYLNAHHIKPLRDFIKEVREKYGIKTFNDVPAENWQPYIDEIVGLHKLEHGITLCRGCHADVDKQYRRRK